MQGCHCRLSGAAGWPGPWLFLLIHFLSRAGKRLVLKVVFLGVGKSDRRGEEGQRGECEETTTGACTAVVGKRVRARKEGSVCGRDGDRRGGEREARGEERGSQEGRRERSRRGGGRGREEGEKEAARKGERRSVWSEIYRAVSSFRRSHKAQVLWRHGHPSPEASPPDGRSLLHPPAPVK